MTPFHFGSISTSGKAFPRVRSQESFPSSTSIPQRVAVMAFVQEPRWKRSVVRTFASFPASRTPAAPRATIRPPAKTHPAMPGTSPLATMGSRSAETSRALPSSAPAGERVARRTKAGPANARARIMLPPRRTANPASRPRFNLPDVGATPERTGPTMDQPASPAKTDHTWEMLCHLSAFTGHLIPLGSFLGPLIVWLVKKGEDPGVDAHGKEAVNFAISMHIWGVVAAILILAFIGFFLLVWLVCVILASVKASNGEFYRYPLTIRFLK